MKYKICIILSILFIISISAVSAENTDMQVIGNSINTSDNIVLADGIDEPTDPGNNEPTEPEDGTFKDLETILWRAQDGDRIVLDRNYSYDGSDRKVMGIYHQLTIDGNGHTLDGKNGARIFYMDSTAKSVTLMNINFVNARINGAGGAILNDGAKLTVINCNFTNNRITGTTGGAISSNNVDNVIITDSKFTGNYATGVGGAVSITGNNAKITNCVFTSNEARDHTGGAVLIYGNYATVTYCNFTSNKAGRDGGALQIEGKTEKVKSQGSTISNNNFIGNSAPFGGAFGFNGKDSTISNNIFTSNKAINSKSLSYAGIGGAMRVMGEKNINVINNTFTDNTAYRQGGAFYLEGYNSVISKNTFTNNHATTDAGGAMNLKGNGIVISENTITTSSSKTAGGAIFINGNNVKITKNVITDTKSTTSYGGSIQIRGDAATITNNEFKQTTAKTNGGALYVMSDKAVINNNIFSKNNAAKGLAIYGKGNTPKMTGNTFSEGKTAKTVLWDKITPKFTAKAKTFKKSVKTKKYTITLKNDWNLVMKSMKVTLKVNKKTYSAKTNSKGQATFKITKLNKKGKFTAVVKFKGNAYYYTVSKKVKITVK